MAGKTTLVNAVHMLDVPPIKPDDRTAGVEVRTGEIPGVGKGSTWDFGAQWTFRSAHGLFFGSSNTIFVLVLRLRIGENVTPEVLLLEKGRYWCAFAKAPLRTLLSDLKSLIPVVLIGNVIGAEEEAGVEASFQLKRVAQILQEEFGDTFHFSCVLEIDCSKSNSMRMNDCRTKLKKLREDLLKVGRYFSRLCRLFFSMQNAYSPPMACPSCAVR